MERTLLLFLLKMAIQSGGNWEWFQKQLILNGFDTGAKEIEKAIKKYHDTLSSVLSEGNLASAGIRNKEYVRDSINSFISHLDIPKELEKVQYDENNLTKYLLAEYKNRGLDLDNIEEIEKGLGLISNKVQSLAKSDIDFVPDMLIKLAGQMDELKKQLSEHADKEADKPAARKSNGLNQYELYLQKWDENMFLNDFDCDDKKKNIQLNELYILPFYKKSDCRKRNIGRYLKSFINGTVNKRNRMLVILGQPGVGKSTLITWLCQYYKLQKQKDNVQKKLIIFKFSSFKQINWAADMYHCNFADEILNELELSKDDLWDKVLVLEGFDEINVSNNYNMIFNQLYHELIYNETKDTGLNLIITCRENYIDDVRKLVCKYIVLEPFNEMQIRKFYKKYKRHNRQAIEEKELSQIVEKKDILGIPLLLYMVLALETRMDAGTSIGEIYDHIFSVEEGGIYERCIINETKAMSDTMHRIAAISAEIHKVTSELAMWMFENSPDKAEVPQTIFKIIVNSIQEKINKGEVNLARDVLIGNYFKFVRHCEGMESPSIAFIHRSIYEYFVADTIFSAIKEAIDNQENIDFAAGIAPLLKQGHVTNEISEFISMKLLRFKYADWFDESLLRMIEHGMFYFYNKNSYDFILEKEAKCFTNILTLRKCFGAEKMIAPNIDKIKYEIFNASANGYLLELSRFKLASIQLPNISLSSAVLMEADLKKADLSGADLSHANLMKADLHSAGLGKANLSEADLRECCLIEANLHNADLSKADLRRADLSWTILVEAKLKGADLKGADLHGANLNGANLSRADLSGANLSGANLNEANLVNAILTEADLTKATLTKANLSHAILSKVNLDGADLNGATFDYVMMADLLCSARDITDKLKYANILRATFTGVPDRMVESLDS